MMAHAFSSGRPGVRTTLLDRFPRDPSDGTVSPYFV